MYRKTTVKYVIIFTFLAMFLFCCYRHYVYMNDYSIYEITIREDLVEYDRAIALIDKRISCDELVLHIDAEYPVDYYYTILNNAVIIYNNYIYAKCSKIYVVVKNYEKDIITFLEDSIQAEKIK